MKNICHVAKPNRKKAGKFGKGLCPVCYPAGSKRRAEAEYAKHEIDNALNVVDIMDEASMHDAHGDDELWQIVFVIGNLLGCTDVEKMIEVFEILNEEE